VVVLQNNCRSTLGYTVERRSHIVMHEQQLSAVVRLSSAQN